MRVILRSILAVGFVAGALGISLAVDSFSRRPTICPFFVAIIISSWYLGPIPAAVSVAATLLAVDWFLVEPQGLAISAADIPRFVCFSIVATLIAWFAAARRRAEMAYREVVGLLEAEVDERNSMLERETAEKRALVEATAQVHAALETRRIAEVRKETEIRALRTSVEALTDRELEIFRLVVDGLMNKQIAAKLRIAEVTVKLHRKNVMRKMGAETLCDLVRRAERLGIGSQDAGK